MHSGHCQKPDDCYSYTCSFGHTNFLQVHCRCHESTDRGHWSRYHSPSYQVSLRRDFILRHRQIRPEHQPNLHNLPVNIRRMGPPPRRPPTLRRPNLPRQRPNHNLHALQFPKHPVPNLPVQFRHNLTPHLDQHPLVIRRIRTLHRLHPQPAILPQQASPMCGGVCLRYHQA